MATVQIAKTKKIIAVELSPMDVDNALTEYAKEEILKDKSLDGEAGVDAEDVDIHIYASDMNLNYAATIVFTAEERSGDDA